MRESRIIVNDYMNGKITYGEGLKRLFALKLDKKEMLKRFNNLRCIKIEFLDGDFYPANLYAKKLTVW